MTLSVLPEPQDYEHHDQGERHGDDPAVDPQLRVVALAARAQRGEEPSAAADARLPEMMGPEQRRAPLARVLLSASTEVGRVLRALALVDPDSRDFSFEQIGAVLVVVRLLLADRFCGAERELRLVLKLLVLSVNRKVDLPLLPGGSSCRCFALNSRSARAFA